jgi:hypothetical protein
MMHFFASDEKHRNLVYDADDRSYRTSPSMSDYRFGKAQGKRDRVHARTASAFVSLLRSAISSVVTFLGPSWDGPVRKYRPEDHYMRGPGPKWREKHVLNRASAGRS